MINIKTDECLLGWSDRAPFCRVGRDEHDLYLDGRFHRLAGRYRNFRYTPVFLSGLRAPTALRVGMVTEAIAADLAAVPAQKHIAGPPAPSKQLFGYCFPRGMTPSRHSHRLLVTHGECRRRAGARLGGQSRANRCRLGIERNIKAGRECKRVNVSSCIERLPVSTSGR